MFTEIFYVGLGGFIGSVLRYLLGLINITESTSFPINTFIINIVGALAIGIIAAYTSKNYTLNENLLLFLQVGICGGFTTFSTFALETGVLLKYGDVLIAFVYVFLTVLLGVLAFFIPALLIK